jgi:hypothetical protein
MNDADGVVALPVVKIIDHDRSHWLLDPAMNQRVRMQLGVLMNKLKSRALSFNEAEIILLEHIRSEIQGESR